MIYCSTQSINRMQIQWDIFDTSWQLFWINLRENNWQEMLMRYFATGGRRILCSSDALARNINRSQKRPDRNCIGAGPWSDMTDYVTPLGTIHKGRPQNFRDFGPPPSPCPHSSACTLTPLLLRTSFSSQTPHWKRACSPTAFVGWQSPADKMK